MEEHPSLIHPWQMNSLDELTVMPMEAAAFGEHLQQAFSHHHQTFNLKPAMEITSPNVFSFVNSNYANQVAVVRPKEELASSKSTATFPSDGLVSQGFFKNQNYVFKAAKRVSHTQDHIIAERKRREKISQRLIALSAIIPGLKKVQASTLLISFHLIDILLFWSLTDIQRDHSDQMDKASVLGDAIKYLKQLQERVKTLEEEIRKKTTETVVLVKKSQLFVDEDNSSSEENFSGVPSDEPLPEIEVRFSDRSVLIRIHCERRKGMVEKLVAEVEGLHLTVTNSSVMIFGGSALDVSIIAQVLNLFSPLKKSPSKHVFDANPESPCQNFLQMEVEFSLTVRELVKKLHAVLN